MMHLKRLLQTLFNNCAIETMLLNTEQCRSFYGQVVQTPFLPGLIIYHTDTNDRRRGDIYIPSNTANDVNLGKHLHALSLLN